MSSLDTYLSKHIRGIINFVIPHILQSKKQRDTIIFYWQLRVIVYEHSARGGASLGPPMTLQSAWRVEKYMNDNKIFVWEDSEFRV